MAAGWVATFLYDRAGGQWEANIFLVLLISDCSGGLADWLAGWLDSYFADIYVIVMAAVSAPLSRPLLILQG